MYQLSVVKAKQTVPNISFSYTIYLNTQAYYDGIYDDLWDHGWPDIIV